MYDRIVEIIVYVVSELKQNKQISEINIDELSRKGYTKSEISTAFSWIADRLELSESFVEDKTYVNPDSFRVLHEVERDMFTTKAWGELVQLHSLGLLTADHIDYIIERGIMSGSRRIDSDALKSYAAGIIFNADNGDSSGNRIMLSGDDAIN